MAWDDDLRGILPPPPGVDPDRQIDWAPQERALALQLPEDYKRFIRIWGPGVLADEVIMLGDVPAGRAPDLSKHALNVDRICRELQANIGGDYDYPNLPDPGAFLSYGMDGSGNYFGWVTGADPSDWNAAVFVDGDAAASVFAGSFADFILAFCRGREDRLPMIHPTLLARPKTYRPMSDPD